MKKLFTLAALTLSVLVLTKTSSFAQAVGTATASATIVTPISIVKVNDMNFGNVAATGTGGTIVLSTSGTRSSSGGATAPAGTPGTVTAASFTVSGAASYTYSIALPTTITLSDGAAHTMTITNFTSNPTPTGTIGGGGSQTLQVGGTLNVGANQFVAAYTLANGLSVTVNYN